MIGGFYVFAIERSTAAPPREYTSLIAGPFATWAEADQAGPAAVKHINDNYSGAALLEYGICEFFAHRLVLGTRNAELWTKPTPVTK